MNAHTGTAIVRRATIEEIVANRNRALELYAAAYEAIGAADAAVKEAVDMAQRAHPGINAYNYQQHEEIKTFLRAVALPDRDLYLKVARKLIDVNAWAWIIERTDLERLMDHEAKETLRKQMQYVPEAPRDHRQLITGDEIAKGLPELTVGNIMATLERFTLDADMIFRRGIANAFSKLDRRFRSHDGFKIGSRMILTYAFSDYGSLNWGAVRDQLIDVERVFAVLDGRPEASFRSALYELSNRGGGHGARQSEHVTDYFRIKGYKNGNAHLWFERRDLVEKVNKLLAEYYGEVIGDGQTQEADPLKDVKQTPAKRYGFYPTPVRAAEAIFERLHLVRGLAEEPLRILEPSAGTGNLARRCIIRPERIHGGDPDWKQKQARDYNAGRRFDNQVDVVELQPQLAAALEAEGIYRKVYSADFLKLSPDTTGLYDVIVMNPPFDRERDIDHVTHALKFMKPGGRLVAIMSAGTEFRDTRKSWAFRALMKARGARLKDLPAGSFAEVGTYVNTIVVTIGGSGYDGHAFEDK